MYIPHTRIRLQVLLYVSGYKYWCMYRYPIGAGRVRRIRRFSDLTITFVPGPWLAAWPYAANVRTALCLVTSR